MISIDKNDKLLFSTSKKVHDDLVKDVSETNMSNIAWFSLVVSRLNILI